MFFIIVLLFIAFHYLSNKELIDLLKMNFNKPEYILCKRNYCSSHWSLETGFETVEDLDNRVREVRGNNDGIGHLVTTTFFETKAIYPSWFKALQGRYYLWQTIKIEN